MDTEMGLTVECEARLLADRSADKGEAEVEWASVRWIGAAASGWMRGGTGSVADERAADGWLASGQSNLHFSSVQTPLLPELSLPASLPKLARSIQTRQIHPDSLSEAPTSGSYRPGSPRVWLGRE